MQLSPNAINTFVDCGKRYDLKYNKGIYHNINSLTFLLGHIAEAMVQFSMEATLLEDPITHKQSWAKAVVACWDKLPPMTSDLQGHFVAWINAVLQGQPDMDELTIALNKGFREADLHGFVYKPRVKINNGKSNTLLTNALLEVLDCVGAFLDRKDYKTFIASVESLDTQVQLGLEVPNWGSSGPVTLKGYADFIFMLPNNRLVCLDAKYSSFDLESYNINRDTQLFCYAAALKKAYPDHAIEVGYMALRDNPKIIMCDMEELLSPVTSSRIGQAVKAIKHGIFMPSCGGGGYQSINKMCDYKNDCSFASCSKTK